MIHSMTGYGKTVLELPSKKITIEIRSLNSKNFDLTARMPSMYREKELEIRKLISGLLKRGKIDFSLYLEITGSESTAHVNQGTVSSYMNQLREIADGDDIDLLQMAVRLPDAVITDREDIDESEWKMILEKINESLKKIQGFRLQEGQALEADFIKRVDTIKTLLSDVIEMDPDRIEAVRTRIRRGIDELKENIDENRFEQELVYYIEKFDINEERVRLANHLDYFSNTLSSNESNGKKLGFIVQEMGREINTIGSKANYAPMQKLVVQMKDELEKIKEQLLNVL